MRDLLGHFRPLALAALAALAGGCGAVWNDPYPAQDGGGNILYSAFTERPKHLDPVQSYSADEAEFNSQIYEPPLQYHYLKRPYALVPLIAAEMPRIRAVDAGGREVAADSPAVAQTHYEIRIRPGILFQPHPAFARGADGGLLYHHLRREDLADIHALGDFPQTGTRELVAADFAYQIKRLAHPRLHSPLFGLMSEYIVGFREFAERLRAEDRVLADAGRPDAWLDLDKVPLAGVELIDRYSYRIRIKGRYPQFAYWLAMNFFAPVPVEADRFFAQPGMAEKNLTLDWYPVGTGPYMLAENNPNARMVLVRNPNFRGEPYPDEGEPGDAAAGLLRDAGKRMPFIDKAVFSREREGIPYWNKFLQGYYDLSGISSDSFDQAVRVSVEGEAGVSPEMAAKGIRLRTSVSASTYYFAFNWLDPVVGGEQPDGATRERARKLRQAISIALDWEEFISIFANGRGIAAQGPIPPGIFGFRDGREGVNPVVYDWVDGGPRRKSIEMARRLLAEAGYPGGRDARTGQPLVLYLDTTDRGPGDKPRLDWYRKQFAKLPVQLEVRGSDYNRFQEKVRKGAAQMFAWGWLADYPDPENFLFLFHGPQSRARLQGENAANYANAEYDRLFEQVKHMQNGAAREALIGRMLAILREDAPWSFGYHPKDYSLYHGWMANLKPNLMARNSLKYQRIDAAQREARRAAWNRPVLWPLGLAALGLAAVAAPAVAGWRRRERAGGRA
ncbi:MAG TPA: ABC transporter substrate-binding protein [Candidatus Desulfobacillus sp.]|nr:ABC transporter substrate-binding protein [Candidatus Desulfobacillus sp.]